MAKFFYDCEFLEGKQKEKFPMSLFRNETKPTIDLISIGIVTDLIEDENGVTKEKSYYAISKEFNIDEAWNRYDLVLNLNESSPFEPKHDKVYWIRENVLIPIFYELANEDFHNIHYKDFWTLRGELVTLEVFKNSGWARNLKWFKNLIEKYGKTNETIRNEVVSFIAENTETNEVRESVYAYDVAQMYAYFGAYDHVALMWIFGKMINRPKILPMYSFDLKQELDIKVRNAGNCITAVDFDKHLDCCKKSPNYPKQDNSHNALNDAKWNRDLYYFLKTL